ncbi:MAG: preprotein translocase subunit SecA [Cytophagales bacterium]|nr:preprotein translocase subunit SecA [Cytophagales bacterium]
MFDIITKGISKLFGSKSDKDLKELTPYISKINDEHKKLTLITDDELRMKTIEFKGRIAAHLSDIDSEISTLKAKVDGKSTLNIHEKEEVFTKVDKLEKDRNKALEEVLMNILPEAFATVKETARRLTENKKLVVKASERDIEFAQRKGHVEIEGNNAIWHNEWDAAGTTVTWNMIHYDVQLVGGIVLHQGKIAEMATGEGKTLVATLPTYLNAIAGRGVHVVTVNDYLAKRDSEWMAPLFEFHGLSIDCIDKHQPNSPARKKAYESDITYGTNNEFGFDYLRDNMANTPDELVQRRHHFAMIDEVDSVLVDDARTPLIISGPMAKGDEQEFDVLKPRIVKVYEQQRKLVNKYLTDAKRLLKEGNEDEGGLALFRAYRGLPKNKPLIKFLGEAGMKQTLQKTENIYIAENNKLMPEADQPLYFTIDEKTNSVELTEKGTDFITGEGEDPNLFVIPDISIDLDKIDNDSSLDEEERLKKKDQIIQDYSLKSKRIHTISQLLKAYTLFEKDTEYIVNDGKVMIVDEQTGRVMDGRRFSDGLHQALEAKENVKIEEATQTYATVTLQNFFRMYHKLSGMTGTAETEAGEFWEIYKLDVVVVPTNRGIKRDDRQDYVYKTVREKFNAVIDETNKLVQEGRPVLIGTTSVEISEVFSRMLKMRGIKHQVLNAKQHAKEADVVAEAGKPGTVTIATNMAGRGTDIKLTAESRNAGGLAIIGTERHESRRVDRQLRGRSGRQGDVGSSQFFVSLEDNLMRLFGSDRISKVMDKMGLEEGEVIQHSMITKSIERAQKKVEENNFAVRKRLLEYDDVMNSQREVIYKRRKNALHGERLELDVLNMVYDLCEGLAADAKAYANVEDIKVNIMSTFGFSSKITIDDITGKNEAQLSQFLYEEAMGYYKTKNESFYKDVFPNFERIYHENGDKIDSITMPFVAGTKQMNVSAKLTEIIDSEGKVIIKNLQKYASLGFIDVAWKEHLREMDDLKTAVQNATIEQKDPVLMYKFEAFELFKKLLDKINQEVVSFLFKCVIPIRPTEEAPVPAPAPQRPAPKPQLREEKADTGSVLTPDQENAPEEEAPKTQPIQAENLPGRNERVSVVYSDGTVKKDVKFKTVEQDVKNGLCSVVEE